MSSTCVEVEDRGFGIIRVRVTPRAPGQSPLACCSGYFDHPFSNKVILV